MAIRKYNRTIFKNNIFLRYSRLYKALRLLKNVYSLGLLLWIFRGTAAGRARPTKTIIQSHFIIFACKLKHEMEPRSIFQVPVALLTIQRAEKQHGYRDCVEYILKKGKDLRESIFSR